MARILIFSNDTDVFDLLGYLLRQEGHRVRVMRAVDARLARVKFFGPELVMIDSASCGAAALELCRSIRSRKALNCVRLSHDFR